ncbi:hypothetical protein BOX15_Mlig012675g1 [Macrostomum lignano]|uniref:Uncharacterized protein n=1 Tax=Macrostomum lignano TaxID=282301 RepID=A0A267FVC0_9PLAT|nr:hypothetical protein BOX15_Mlig012675g1 [Macrostomum lignano]
MLYRIGISRKALRGNRTQNHWNLTDEKKTIAMSTTAQPSSNSTNEQSTDQSSCTVLNRPVWNKMRILIDQETAGEAADGRWMVNHTAIFYHDTTP